MTTDWRLLALILGFVYVMARTADVNPRAMKFAGFFVLALAGYKTVPMIAAGMAPLGAANAPEAVAESVRATDSIGVRPEWLDTRVIHGEPAMRRVERMDMTLRRMLVERLSGLMDVGVGTVFGDSVGLDVQTLDGAWVSVRVPFDWSRFEQPGHTSATANRVLAEIERVVR